VRLSGATIKSTALLSEFVIRRAALCRVLIFGICTRAERAEAVSVTSIGACLCDESRSLATLLEPASRSRVCRRQRRCASISAIISATVISPYYRGVASTPVICWPPRKIVHGSIRRMPKKVAATRSLLEALSMSAPDAAKSRARLLDQGILQDEVDGAPCFVNYVRRNDPRDPATATGETRGRCRRRFLSLSPGRMYSVMYRRLIGVICLGPAAWFDRAVWLGPGFQQNKIEHNDRHCR